MGRIGRPIPEAAHLEPQEDYYYLFLGRSLLQLSDVTQPGNAVLPEDLSNTPTDQLLGVVDRGLQSRTREDVMRAANAALVGAQRLNPLNTDHAANLARLNRAWAFTGAVGPGESGDYNRLREVLAQQPDKVNQPRLLDSIDYYRQAVALSPQNAGLWNELATMQYIQGDLAGAADTIVRSLQVDDRFFPTYLLLGDVRTAQNDLPAALRGLSKGRGSFAEECQRPERSRRHGRGNRPAPGVGRRLPPHHRPGNSGAPICADIARHAEPGSDGCGRL